VKSIKKDSIFMVDITRRSSETSRASWGNKAVSITRKLEIEKLNLSSAHGSFPKLLREMFFTFVASFLRYVDMKSFRLSVNVVKYTFDDSAGKSPANLCCAIEAIR